MTDAGRGAAVVPAGGAASPPDAHGYEVRIDRESVGCQNLVQRVLRSGPGTTPEMRHEVSEDVMYVLSGSGEATIGERTVALIPGTGVLVPAATPYKITNHGPDSLEILSVLSPQPGLPGTVPAAAGVNLHGSPTVHQSAEPVLPAGDDESRDLMDRYFMLMIDPDHGAHYVTQFVGFIERSKAPMHTHTYEEVVYITGGNGIVHIAEGDFPISAGSSIYLPPGTPHCLENPSDTPMSLVGVFCPAGSPASRQKA